MMVGLSGMGQTGGKGLTEGGAKRREGGKGGRVYDYAESKGWVKE